MKAKKLINIVLYILFLFAIQEMALRYLFPLPDIENFDRSIYVNTGDNSSRPYARHQDWYWESSVDTTVVFHHDMNGYGFRDKEWKVKKSANRSRVLFVGDSFVEGIMAAQDETIGEGFLTKAGTQQYEVLNAGMLGMGLSEYLQLTADVTPAFKPDHIFFCIYANDLGEKPPVVPEYFLEPVYYNSYRPRLFEILRQTKKHGPVPFRWSKSKSLLPACPSPKNPWTSRESELSPQVKPNLAEAMKAGTFNPYRVNGILLEEKHLKNPPPLGETLPFLKYIGDKFNAKPVVVYIPSRNQITKHYYAFEKESCLQHCHDSLDLTRPAYQIHQQVLAKACAAVNLPFIDLSAFIRKQESKGNNLYWDYDEHMKGSGYRAIGGEVWRKWREFRR